MSERAVLGIGLSSRASSDEVRQLVEEALREHALDLADVAVIATRRRFAADARLRLGPPVVGFADAELESASEPCARTFGIHARVAETAAGLAGSGVVGPLRRSAHVTLAIGMLP